MYLKCLLKEGRTRCILQPLVSVKVYARQVLLESLYSQLPLNTWAHFNTHKVIMHRKSIEEAFMKVFFCSLIPFQRCLVYAQTHLLECDVRVQRELASLSADTHTELGKLRWGGGAFCLMHRLLCNSRTHQCTVID